MSKSLITLAAVLVLACAVQAVVELTTIKPGELVAVSGPGPIGLLCAMLAKAHGARVVVLGTSGDEGRMALARQIGADRTVDVVAEDAKAVIGELTDGYGADVVFECAGVEASAALGLELVRKMGRYTQVGIFGKPIQVDLDKVVVKQVHFQGSMCHTWATWEQTMRLLAEGLIDLRPLISRRLPLGQWEDGFQGVLARQDMKVLLYPEE